MALRLVALALCALAAGVAAYHDAPIVNDRPVIGILTLPNDQPGFSGRSYFPSSYVKFLEAGGARVVPIPFTMELSDITTLVNQLNGVLWTGGGASLVQPNGQWTPVAQAALTILDTIIAANKRGEYMPLWTTCMGFEMLSVLVAADPNVLVGGFDSENLTLALNFTDYAKSARMLANVPRVAQILSTQAVTMNMHEAGVPPNLFYGNSNLTSFFNVVSTNVDRKGKEFVSTMEGRNYPVYATQWHPEKVMYEWWSSEVINHTPDSVYANSHFSMFFVNETRKNDHKFTSEGDLSKALIYNYDAVYTGPAVGEFEQCYFFD